MKQSHETRARLAYESNKSSIAHEKDHTHKHRHMNQSTEMTLHEDVMTSIYDSYPNSSNPKTFTREGKLHLESISYVA
jgi:hypothetical protein